MTELKLCPFCGGKPYFDKVHYDEEDLFNIPTPDNDYVVGCQDCGIVLPPDEKEKQIKDWNQRKEGV